MNDVLRKIRSERYAMQSIAKLALPDERVSRCLRRLSYASGNVEVWKHKQTRKSFYSGLLVCGSVWHCPVCAAKISERRKIEIKTAFELHKQNGGNIAMLTLTFSHTRFDNLKYMLERFKKVTNKFFSGKMYDKVRKRIKLLGRIRVMEVTYGNNGWHPHLHIGLLYYEQVNLKELELELFKLYEKACSNFGLKIIYPFGLKLQSAEDAEEYFSKFGTWSIEQELSKSHIKRGKKDSLTPFDFLRNYLIEENVRYLTLFKDYAFNFKGKRQIQWSQGLKKTFGIEEKTDSEIAIEKIEKADLLGLLTYGEWKKILKNDLRAKFLDLVEKYGFEYAYDLVIDDKEKDAKISAYVK